jgi:acetoin utilization deacetylase AcuC-like enzyme
VKAFSCDQYAFPLPSFHTFPIAKYTLLRQRVLEQRIVAAHELLDPPAARIEQLALVHDPQYLRRVVEGGLSAAEVRELGLPWSTALVERSRRSVGGTIEAGRWALREGVAVNLAGGTHHAAHAKGAGYCVFNDIAVAIRVLQAEGRIDRALVVDCDVHHGDGTAELFSSDPSVFTFSIHGARNYPLRKPPSDLDEPLADGTGDAVYLEALDRGLAAALERARADLVFFLAGADPYEGDRLGRLKLTIRGLAERDRHVFDACFQKRVPIAVTMAGGYAREIGDTVAIQAETVRQASRFFHHWTAPNTAGQCDRPADHAWREQEEHHDSVE